MFAIDLRSGDVYTAYDPNTDDVHLVTVLTAPRRIASVRVVFEYSRSDGRTGTASLPPTHDVRLVH